MIDRVTDATGRLGPVGDAEAMAANILAVWSHEDDAMREAARAHALQFSWHSSMEIAVRARLSCGVRAPLLTRARAGGRRRGCRLTVQGVFTGWGRLSKL